MAKDKKYKQPGPKHKQRMKGLKTLQKKTTSRISEWDTGENPANYKE